jgi:hypothetical protein
MLLRTLLGGESPSPEVFAFLAGGSILDLLKWVTGACNGSAESEKMGENPPSHLPALVRNHVRSRRLSLSIKISHPSTCMNLILHEHHKLE